MDVAETSPNSVCVNFGIFWVEDYCATTCLSVYTIAARRKKLILSKGGSYINFECLKTI